MNGRGETINMLTHDKGQGTTSPSTWDAFSHENGPKTRTFKAKCQRLMKEHKIQKEFGAS